MKRTVEKWFCNIILKLYNVYALGWLLILLLLLFPFGSILILFRSPSGANLFYKVCRVFARFWLFVVAIIYEGIHEEDSPMDFERPFIYVANHRSYVDVLLMLASIKGAYRPLGKVEMTRIPLFGFFYRKLIITVKRNEAMSRTRSYIEMNKTLDQQISVFIFPEGTFNETKLPLKSFYNGTFQLALKKKISIRPVVFLDNIKRMHYNSIFSLRPGICRVMFLKEVKVEPFLSGGVNALKQDIFERMFTVLVSRNDRYIAVK